MPSPARSRRVRRAPAEITLDGHVYRFGLFSATLALRMEFWLTEAIANIGDGSHPSSDEILAHVTCDGQPVLSIPDDHAGKVLLGLVAYNFADFGAKTRRKAASR